MAKHNNKMVSSGGPVVLLHALLGRFLQTLHVNMSPAIFFIDIVMSKRFSFKICLASKLTAAD